MLAGFDGWVELRLEVTWIDWYPGQLWEVVNVLIIAYKDCLS